MCSGFLDKFERGFPSHLSGVEWNSLRINLMLRDQRERSWIRVAAQAENIHQAKLLTRRGSQAFPEIVRLANGHCL
jgi:hypothetical protein